MRSSAASITVTSESEVFGTHTHSNAPATPAAASPASDTTEDRIAHERQFIFDVLAEALGELDARHRAEIQSLKDEVADLKRAFFNTPRDMVEGARELSAQSDKVMAAVAALHAASERDQQQRRDPVDLPALPRRRDFN